MLYSMEKSRKVLRRWQGKPEGPDPDKPRIPDNSEPWLPGGVRSVADALWISDRIKETAERWGLNKLAGLYGPSRMTHAFPDPIDLLVSKQETGRDKDQTDIISLEGRSKRIIWRASHRRRRTKRCKCSGVFSPRAWPRRQLAHSDPAVRDLGMRFLRELSEEGDPFAAEILRKIGELRGGERLGRRLEFEWELKAVSGSTRASRVVPCAPPAATGFSESPARAPVTTAEAAVVPGSRMGKRCQAAALQRWAPLWS